MSRGQWAMAVVLALALASSGEAAWAGPPQGSGNPTRADKRAEKAAKRDQEKANKDAEKQRKAAEKAADRAAREGSKTANEAGQSAGAGQSGGKGNSAEPGGNQDASASGSPRASGGGDAQTSVDVQRPNSNTHPSAVESVNAPEPVATSTAMPSEAEPVAGENVEQQDEQAVQTNPQPEPTKKTPVIKPAQTEPTVIRESDDSSMISSPEATDADRREHVGSPTALAVSASGVEALTDISASGADAPLDASAAGDAGPPIRDVGEVAPEEDAHRNHLQQMLDLVSVPRLIAAANGPWKGKDILLMMGAVFALGFAGGAATRRAFERRSEAPVNGEGEQGQAQEAQPQESEEVGQGRVGLVEGGPSGPGEPVRTDRWFAPALPGFRPYDSGNHVKLIGGPVSRVRVDDPRPYRSHCQGPLYSLCGVSVRGPGHVKTQTRCQDAHRCAVLEDGTVVVAVADGVGSADLSDIGARFATQTAVELLIEELRTGGNRNAHDVMRGVIEAARAQLCNYAEKTNTDLRALACTLLLVVLRRGVAHTAQVGDGAMVMLRNGEWVVASAPEETAYVNYVTPLTSSNWAGACRLNTVDEVSAIYVFSDGIERSCVSRVEQGYVVNEGFFGPIHDATTSAETVEDATRRVAKTLDGPRLAAASDDDKTLVVVWSKTGAGDVLR